MCSLRNNEHSSESAWISICVWWFPPHAMTWSSPVNGLLFKLRLFRRHTARKQGSWFCESLVREQQREQKEGWIFFHLHLFPSSIKNSLEQSFSKFIAKWIISTKFQTIKTPHCFVTEGLLLWSSRTHQTLVGFSSAPTSQNSYGWAGT